MPSNNFTDHDSVVCSRENSLYTEPEWFVGLSLNSRYGRQIGNKRFTFVPTPYLKSSTANNVVVMVKMLMIIDPFLKPTRHVVNIRVTSFNQYFVKLS